MQFKRRFVYIALCCVLLSSSVVLLIDVRAQAPTQAQIVFRSHRDGNGEIFAMDADGKNQTRLTNNPAGGSMPSWSPDGQSIAFTSRRDGNAEIYVMDADGKNQRNLTKHSAHDEHPDWFEPGFTYAVEAAGKLRGTWGWLKRHSK